MYFAGAVLWRGRAIWMSILVVQPRGVAATACYLDRVSIVSSAASPADLQYPRWLGTQILWKIGKLDRYSHPGSLELQWYSRPEKTYRLGAGYVFQKKTVAGPVRQNRVEVAALGGEEGFDARLPRLGCFRQLSDVVGCRVFFVVFDFRHFIGAPLLRCLPGLGVIDGIDVHLQQ